MMMSDDKKKQATLIIAKMGKKPTEAPTNEAGDEMDASVGHLAAAEEIMSALEKKDASALKDALKSFVSMCQDEEMESEEPGETES